jgi:hypothetical protein
LIGAYSFGYFVEGIKLAAHIIEMVHALDEDAARLVACQVTDKASADYGGFLLPSHYVEPRMSGFGFSRVALAYLCKESVHFLSEKMRAALEASFSYMARVQRPDGCFDLSGCNFASPPDTAFMINAVLFAWWTLEKRGAPETLWLREPMFRLIDSAAQGIAAGGFHTPNHRWAIASCLMHCWKITGREPLKARAETYLSEGLDINADGEFAERSSGNYNQVNDDQMIRLYLATGDVQFLDAARRNLEMTYAFIDPDDSVFTNNSTRQDRGRTVFTDSYYGLFLMTGWLLKDKRLGAMAEWVYNSSQRHGKKPGGVEWLLLYPEADGFGSDEPHESSDLPLWRYDRVFPDSKIARVRDGNISYTLMEGKANFLYFQHGSFPMYMVIYSNICDRRNFIAETMERADGGFRLRARAEGWYYLPWDPADPDKPDTSDWWSMDNKRTRKKIQGLPLDTTVAVTAQDKGVDVRIRTEGIDRLPLRVEIGFAAPCSVRTDSFLLEGKAGESIVMLRGEAEVAGSGGEIISIGPLFGSHGLLGRSDGAYPQSGEHFTMFLTAVTPVDHTLKIRAAPLPPLEKLAREG